MSRGVMKWDLCFRETWASQWPDLKGSRIKWRKGSQALTEPRPHLPTPLI